MPTLIFVRHGETNGNIIDTFNGIADAPEDALNAKGVTQIRELSKVLSTISFDAAYSSPLQRARRSAEILLENRHLTPIIDPRLNEVDYGQASGWPVTKWLEAHPPKDPERWREDYLDTPYPGGESYRDCLNRLEAFGRDIAGRPEGTLLIVTHTLPIRLMLSVFYREDPRLWLPKPIANAGAYRAEMQNDGRWGVEPLHPKTT